MPRSAFAFLVALLAVVTTASPRTWVIRPDGSGDAPTIRAGVTAASAGDTVLVCCGIYYERNIALKSGIYLTSETGTADCVTIDGEYSYERILYCDDVDSTASLVGFTIRRGGNTVAPGGGICCYQSHPSITNCAFRQNVCEGPACPGGGIYCYESNPRVTNCTFQENSTYEAHGGGACLQRSSPVFTDCVFDRNSAVGTLRVGGGVCAIGGSPRFEDCVFSENTASLGLGGGFGCDDGACPLIVGCLFDGNSGGSGGGVAVGGSFVLPDRCSVEIRRSTFYGNQSGTQFGGGLWCHQDHEASLDNVIVAFSANSSAIGWDGSLPEPLAPVLTCCDLFGNQQGDWVGHIADQYGVRGNICEDPLFCDAGAGDFRLSPGSPCLDADSCGTCGAYGAGCDPVSSVCVVAASENLGLSAHSWPTPVKGGTRIELDLTAGGRLTIAVYDVRGELVATLADEYASAGRQSVVWDCTGSDGAPAASGVYFCRASLGRGSVTLKIVVLR